MWGCEYMTQSQETKKNRPSIVTLIIVAIITGIIFSSCNTDKSKISKEVYRKFASDIIRNGGDPEFTIDNININGNRAEINFRLLGGSYKTVATKIKGEWVVR